MSLPSNDRIRAIRAKLARGEALDPAEELDWMDAQSEHKEAPREPHDETEKLPRMDDDEENVEHHDVGLRRDALNVLYIHRGEMFGTAIPLDKDMNATLMQLQQMVVEVYAARRQNK